MIIKDEDKSLPLQPENIDTLPPYSPATLPQRVPNAVTGSSSSITSAASSSSVPHIPRSNFLCIQRNNTSLKGQYVIDPTLNVPEAVLPPLEPGQERRNLLLECQNGGINADIHLVGPGICVTDEDENGSMKRRATTIDVTGRNGFIAVKLSAPNEHSFALCISAHNGGISLCIPNGFTGPLTTRTENGWVSFSNALSPHVTTFSDLKNTRKCFVGDFASSGYGRQEWQGSSIELDCHNGRVKLCYADETDEQASSKSGSSKFFGRLLGFKS